MIGRTLSHYTLISKIGEGGMGEVYRAEDSQLKRQIALKVLPEEFAADDERLRRFRREAELLASLDHPGIVTVHSVEEDQGVHFLTMALVEGRTLSSVLATGRLDLRRILAIAEPIAEALAAAHDKGITHRDLKPGNVMLSDEGRVRILDFGLAKFQAEKSHPLRTQAPTETMTEEGQLLGTLPYMSPEQVEGRAVDSRSDIFSFGTMLHEMASGSRPFEAETRPRLAYSILEKPPPSLEELRPDLPRQLGRIVTQCLEKDPKDRFQTARDVFNQLRALRREVDSDSSRVAGAGGAATAPGTGRRRPPLWVPLVAAAVLVAGIAGWAWSRSRYSGELPAHQASETPADLQMIAVMPFQNLGSPEEAYFAAGITDEITSRISGAEGLSVRSRNSVRQYDRSGKTTAQIGSDLGVDYLLEGTVRWAHAAADSPSQVRITPQLIRIADDTEIWSQSYNRVIDDIFSIQAEIATNVLDRLGLALSGLDASASDHRGTDDLEAYDQFLRGNEYLLQGSELLSANEIEIAAGFFEKAVALDDGYALAHAQLARVHTMSYQYFFDRSQARLDRVRESAQRALVLAPNLPEGHLALGNYFRDRSEFDEALHEYALARQGRPGDAEIVQAIGELQIAKGDPSSAIASLGQAVELDPSKAHLHCLSGAGHMMANEYSPALDRHARAIAMRPERACPYWCTALILLSSEGPDSAHRWLGTIPDNFGLHDDPQIAYSFFVVDLALGRFDEALERLRTASYEAAVFRSFYYPTSLLAGDAYLLAGNETRATESYQIALDHLDKKLRSRPSDPRFHASRGLALAGLGRRSEAIASGLHALDLHPPDKDRIVAPWRVRDLAQIYVMLGDLDAAIETLESLFSAASTLGVPEIRLDPRFAVLRGDPSFDKLEKAS